MAKDERLLPLPAELHKSSAQPFSAQSFSGVATVDAPTTYAPVYDNDAFVEKRRSIREYINVVLKRKWIVLAIVTIVTVSTAIYMYRLPSQYAAQTDISIEPRKPKQNKDAININLATNDNIYRNTQLKLIQSPELMRDVVVSLGLQKNPDLLKDQSGGFFGRIGTVLTGKRPNQDQNRAALPTLSEQTADNSSGQTLTPDEQKLVDVYSRTLGAALVAVPDPSSYLVTLKYQSTNPQLAVSVPNAVAKVFIQQDINRETAGYKQQSEDNIKQIADLQQTINTQENERIAYLKASQLPLTEGGQNLIATRLQTISSQWLAAEDELRKLRASLESAIRAKAGGNPFSIPEINESAAVQNARNVNATRIAKLKERLDALDDQIAGLQSQRSELLGRYTEEYREVKQIDARIKRVETNKELLQERVSAEIAGEEKTLLKNSTNDVLGSMRARYEAAAQREAQLKQMYFQERAKSNEQGQSEIKMTTLTQQIDTNRKLLDGALQRQKELELQVNSSRPDNIKITNPAQQAQLVGPRRNSNILIALLVSLGAGIGLAFLLDYLDDSVKSSDDIGRHLGLPTLALIPYNELEVGKSAKKLIGKAQDDDAAPKSGALVSLDDARSATAEAYRHLRTSLLFSSAGKPPQAILVTSSQPSEGKTTTAINTAITLAQSGADVVIVDCDLRRPRLHHHFEIDNLHGITNYLSGERDAGLLLKEHPRIPNLKVVTSGPIPPNPAEMLGSNEMRSFVDYLRANFKHVVIDSPPAISFTDATIISTLVDGVVIVAMAGKSSIHLIRQFKTRLGQMGVKIYGVVLNGLRRNSIDYGYGYYGYGYNYYSGYEDDDPTTARLEK